MWLVLALFGCDQAVRSGAPTPEATERAQAPGRLDCAAHGPACRQAENRLAEIQTELDGLDCSGGGAADPDACAAAQSRLEREKAAILSQYGTRTTSADGGGEAPTPSAAPAEAADAPPPPRRRRGRRGQTEGMEIDINDE
ncbi:MAG: hypothetical protein AAF211_01350 [Myxococcota bacterium]